MRHAHDRLPAGAVAQPVDSDYPRRMKTPPLARRLRRSALALLLAGVAVWLFAGARVGWTQTSRVTVQRDEITGIDYPVREPAFLPGVEIPLGAAGLAGVLAGLGWAAARRRPAGA